MNLKFTEDIYKTFISMKSSIYFLGYLAGVHAITFAAYVAYKYINEQNTKNDDTQDTDNTNENKTTEDKEDSKILEPEPEIQMEQLDSVSHIKEELYTLLTSKKDELETLITQLNNIQDNIGTIRDKLEELHKSP